MVMPGEVPGPSPTRPISLVRASAGKSPFCVPVKGRWLNRKATLGTTGCPWRCHLPAFASLTALLCYFFNFYCSPLQADQKHKVLQRGPCAAALTNLLLLPVTPPSFLWRAARGSRVSARGKQRAGKDRKSGKSTHRSR